MREVTEAEFNRYPIWREPAPVQILFGIKPTEERRWFVHGVLLGIVVFDNIDKDWSFVALRKRSDEHLYRVFDICCSYPDQEAAARALEQVLVHGVRTADMNQVEEHCARLRTLLGH